MKFLMTIVAAFFVVVFFVGLFSVVHAVDSVPKAIEENKKEKLEREEKFDRQWHPTTCDGGRCSRGLQ